MKLKLQSLYFKLSHRNKIQIMQLIKRWLTYILIFVSAVLLTDQYREYRQLQEFEDVRKDLIRQEEEAVKQQEKKCLTNALYYEARSEGTVGILAVASVIENRKEHQNYPGTYCGIINQRKQFSYVALRKPDVESIEQRLKASDRVAYMQVSEVADNMVEGRFKRVLPSNVLHYATTKISNAWTKTKKVYATIGNHRFYKENSNEATRTR
jgi:spore germination cell wall hydrolase CwlJ-like protein